MSCSYTSAILKVDAVCDVTVTSTPNVLTKDLCDLLYNQCINNTYSYSFFIYPTGQIRIRKIRFVSTGENRGKPCLVCKNNASEPLATYTLVKDIYMYYEDPMYWYK